MKIVACMPVYGRRRVLSRTLTRLYQKNKIDKVICVGKGEKDKMVVEAFGGEWVEAENSPLGHKWNEAFAAAEKYNPDACLYIGSDDWLQDDWFDIMEPYLQDYDMVGTVDFTMCDIRNRIYRVAYCGGYPEGSHRAGEPVGGGRMLSNKLLKGMNWRPFDEDWENSMDYSMMCHANKLGGKVITVPKGSLIVLALSSNTWLTKHSYSQVLQWENAFEYNEAEGLKILEDKFPEALTLFDDDKWITT